ncbi:hypothetical protein DFJ73DRAFT_961283 [Zopfochytrium polystomum]|nr:hypothetical protein DFJ73DRAFT_961283 [Zopfochytrium polystomum]
MCACRDAPTPPTQSLGLPGPLQRDAPVDLDPDLVDKLLRQYFPDPGFPSSKPTRLATGPWGSPLASATGLQRARQIALNLSHSVVSRASSASSRKSSSSRCTLRSKSNRVDHANCHFAERKRLPQAIPVFGAVFSQAGLQRIDSPHSGVSSAIPRENADSTSSPLNSAIFPNIVDVSPELEDETAVGLRVGDGFEEYASKSSLRPESSACNRQSCLSETCKPNTSTAPCDECQCQILPMEAVTARHWRWYDGQTKSAIDESRSRLLYEEYLTSAANSEATAAKSQTANGPRSAATSALRRERDRQTRARHRSSVQKRADRSPSSTVVGGSPADSSESDEADLETCLRVVGETNELLAETSQIVSSCLARCSVGGGEMPRAGGSSGGGGGAGGRRSRADRESAGMAVVDRRLSMLVRGEGKLVRQALAVRRQEPSKQEAPVRSPVQQRSRTMILRASPRAADFHIGAYGSTGQRLARTQQSVTIPNPPLPPCPRPPPPPPTNEDDEAQRSKDYRRKVERMSHPGQQLLELLARLSSGSGGSFGGRGDRDRHRRASLGYAYQSQRPFSFKVAKEYAGSPDYTRLETPTSPSPPQQKADAFGSSPTAPLTSSDGGALGWKLREHLAERRRSKSMYNYSDDLPHPVQGGNSREAQAKGDEISTAATRDEAASSVDGTMSPRITRRAISQLFVSLVDQPAGDADAAASYDVSIESVEKQILPNQLFVKAPSTSSNCDEANDVSESIRSCSTSGATGIKSDFVKINDSILPEKKRKKCDKRRLNQPQQINARTESGEGGREGGREEGGKEEAEDEQPAFRRAKLFKKWRTWGQSKQR